MKNSATKDSKISCVAALVFFLVTIPAIAQLPTASILGTVNDSSGALVAGAVITIKNLDTGFTRTATTESDGTFKVPELATGRYEVQASHEGFKTATHGGITLEVTQLAVVNFTLQVGNIQQMVVVRDLVPMVNSQDSTLGGLVNETSIKDLPLNGRNYVDLTLLQPGVAQSVNFEDNHTTANGAGFGTVFSVNGAPVRSNNFTLDGAVLQNQWGLNASSMGDTTLGVEGIKEYKVITSNYPAEYGLSMGSQTVMVSSSGSNAFHGDVFYFMRNAALDATPNTPNAAQISDLKPQFQRNNFGGSFGGPIQKDKTFFFGVYEGLRQNLGVSNTVTAPAAGCHPPPGVTVITNAECPDLGFTPSVTINPGMLPFLALYPLPPPSVPANVATPEFNLPGTSTSNENYGQMRVDHNFSLSDTFFARYTGDDDVLYDAPGSNNQSAFQNFAGGAETRNQYITLAENHIFNTVLLNTARFSFSRTKFTTTTIFQGLPNNNQGPPIIAFGGLPRAIGLISVPNYEGDGRNYSDMGQEDANPAYGTQNVYTLSDDLNFIRGKHAFKFGALLNRWNQGIGEDNYYNGALVFYSLAQFLESTPNQVIYEPTGSNENRNFIYNTLGFYAQDDWRVTSRLTWNLGLRYEFNTTPTDSTGHNSRLLDVATGNFTLGPIMKNNSLRNFSPRIGFAWDVFGNGKTAVRAGFGIYYDTAQIGTALRFSAIGTLPFASRTIENLSGFQPVALPLTTETSEGVTPQFIDYNSKNPYVEQYNLSIQQQLPWGMALGLAYVGTQGVHLFTMVDSNPFQPTSTGPCGDPASVCANGAVQFWDTGASNYGIRSNSNFASTIDITTAAHSSYNGLQVTLNKRVRHGLELQSSYSYSKVLDDTQGQADYNDCAVNAGLRSVDPSHLSLDRGPACFDSRHNWHTSVIYRFPKMAGNGFAAKAADGWWVSSIVSIQTGYPLSAAYNYASRSNSGVLNGAGPADRVNANTPALIAKYYGDNGSNCTSLPGQPAAGTNPCTYVPIPFSAATATKGTCIINGNPVAFGNTADWFNPCMFSEPPQTLSANQGGPNCPANSFALPCTVGQLGTASRNLLYGPGSATWNFSMVKDTKTGFLGEAGLIQFRAEIFNVLNHPNYLLQNFTPFATYATGNFGQPVPTLGPFAAVPNLNASEITKTLQNNQRQIQFALKLIF